MLFSHLPSILTGLFNAVTREQEVTALSKNQPGQAQQTKLLGRGWVNPGEGTHKDYKVHVNQEI